MLVAVTPGRLAGGKIPHRLVAAERDQAVQQRHIDILAPAAYQPVVQRVEDGDARVHAGQHVGHGHADLLGAAAGSVITLAGDAHEPAERPWNTKP